jgi:NADH-quinone oxidoreductase subunit L
MLFLGAGSVIHGMHHEQDMRNYGGLRKKLPYTFWAMMIGTLAITGVGIPLSGYIGFAGFASKDAVIESAYAATNGGYAFWMLVIAALFTSFYSWRLIFLTFYGKPRGDKHTHDHAHESPRVMLVPLGVLAVGAVFAGAIWYGSFFGKTNEVVKFFGGQYEEPAKELAAEVAENNPKASKLKYVMASEPGEAAIYIKPENTILHEAHYVPTWVKLSPFVAMLLGLITALWFYIWDPSMPRKVAESQRPLYLFLLNKWYFDEIYDFLFVRPAQMLGRLLWKRGDGAVIDGSINGIAMGIVPFFTRLAGRAQSGYIFTYAFAMVIGIAVLVTWMTFSGGSH